MEGIPDVEVVMFRRFRTSKTLVTTLLLLLAAATTRCAHAPPPSPAESSASSGAATAPAASASTPPPSLQDALLEKGRRWTRAFFEGHTQEMWDRMGPDLRKLTHDKAGLDAFRQSALAQLGAESGVVDERAEVIEGVPAYVRIARFERAPMPVRVVFAFDADDRIIAFAIRPDAAPHAGAAPGGELGRTTRTALYHPFAYHSGS